MINGFDEAIKKIKYVIQYGFHCNDLNFGEMEEDICFALDKLAKENSEPEINWEEEDD